VTHHPVSKFDDMVSHIPDSFVVSNHNHGAAVLFVAVLDAGQNLF
jgi:hypothetical protein